ncbi:MAG: bifunctional pyr operon transcriptional regulator/uracil phosphoribosyltransferase PyrR [Thermodesulfobacteriota bacterium]
MTSKKTTLMTAEDIERVLQRMALQLLERNRSTDKIAVIGIHTGGVFLADRLQRLIRSLTGERVVPAVGSLDITLYRDDWSLAWQNPVVKKTDIAFSVDDKTVILVDDVLFTGRTIRAALDALMDFGRPHSIQLAVLVDRGCRELPIQPDYVGRVVRTTADEHVDVLLQETGATDEVLVESFRPPA